MTNKKLNGSVDLLAKALRGVLTEAIEVGQDETRKDMAIFKKDMAIFKKDMAILKKDMESLSGTMVTQASLQQKQFHQHRKDVVADIKAVIRSNVVKDGY